ncbi:MAG: hypothetical protein ACLRWM_04775 [Streptococcus sp.]
MKENNKNIVLYSAEKNGFLTSYKDKGNIAFTATFDPRLWKALQLPIEPYEKQKAGIDKLAEVFDCEVLIVEAEYNVTKLDGSTLNARSVKNPWRIGLSTPKLIDELTKHEVVEGRH